MLVQFSCQGDQKINLGQTWESHEGLTFLVGKSQWYKRRAPRKIKTFYVTLFTATVMYIEAFFNKISLETHPVFKQLLAEEENGP